MTPEDRPAFIIGARAANYKAEDIPGTRTLDCELCGEPTLFAPSSLNRPEAKRAEFICADCASKLGGPSEVAPPTREQMGEVADALRKALDESGAVSSAERAPDNILIGLRDVYLASVKRHAFGELPALPKECVLSILNELIERRGVASGAIAELLSRAPTLGKNSMLSRPNDSMLEELAHTWRELALMGGPGHTVTLPAAALVTLADELIEWRKAPRA